MTTNSEQIGEPAGQQAPAAESSRRLKTRQRLIDAAYTVFAERGFAAASVEHIVEQAGFTRGAFYSNFESKVELFFALAEQENGVRFERLEAGIATYLPEDSGPRALSAEQITQVVREFLSLQPDDRMWFLLQSEFSLLAMRDPELGKAYLEGERMMCGKLAERLSAMLAAVGLRFTIDPEIMARVLADMYTSGMQDMVLAGSDSPGADAIDAVADTISLFVRALTTPLDEPGS